MTNEFPWTKKQFGSLTAWWLVSGDYRLTIGRRAGQHGYMTACTRLDATEPHPTGVFPTLDMAQRFLLEKAYTLNDWGSAHGEIRERLAA